MRASEFIIHNIFIHNTRTWSKNSPRKSSCRWSLPTKRSSRITKRPLWPTKRSSMTTKRPSKTTKRTSKPSCWGLRNHGCVYLWQLREVLGIYLLHYQMFHHHSANHRLCRKTKQSWNINRRIRSRMVSWIQHLSNRLPVRRPYYLGLRLLELKQASWSRARIIGKHLMTRKRKTDS